jgi:hypothetical protein
MIYNFAQQLGRKENWEPEERDGNWEYYSTHPLFLNDWRAYEMIWCLKDNANFLGIITCYRRSKYDKDHEK